MSELSPGYLALIDQARAGAEESLDEHIEWVRGLVHEFGDTKAAAVLEYLLDEKFDHDVVTGLACLALMRLANADPERKRADA